MNDEQKPLTSRKEPFAELRDLRNVLDRNTLRGGEDGAR